ncbi:MAG TPA: LacI family DNA-binding transcriptional regulator [Atribacteraceae bacterium]|nr:LacI family DNA-binding transcriptional regulator [Atribacteraceae bacterium]
MTSIKDVAHLAKVSPTTVSRVINKSNSVTPLIRERVWKAVEQLNYKPNLLARSLRSQKSKLIGFLVPNIENPIFSRLAKYVEESASRRGYNVILCNTGDDPEREKVYLDILFQHQVEGIIFSRVSDESSLFKSIHLESVPYVVLDRALDSELSPTVKLDNFKAGYLAARHLVELGHQRIACISGPQKIKLCRERLAGYQHALLEAKILFPETFMVEGDFKIEGGYTQGLSLLSKPFSDRPSAILCMNDLTAFGVMQAAREKGVTIPGHLSLTGIDDSPMSKIVYPPLTTVAQPFDRIAREGVEMMIKQIKGVKLRKKLIVIEPQLIIRSSTAPPTGNITEPFLYS